MLVSGAQAATVDERLSDYQRQGAKNFSAQAGEALWNKEFTDARSGEKRSCASCHHANLAQAGKHAETGKPIKPMKPAANPERLTDAKKIEKWFLRNCKWTYGRECTAQEKGDFLTFINQ
jgi:hypothetical protein